MIGMLIFAIFMLIYVSFGLTFVFGAPWVPSRKTDVRAMLKLANVKKGDVVTDLGSGDGRLLVMAVKEFGAARAVGHEIHPGLIAYARIRAILNGVSEKISFKRGNMYKLPIEETDVVVLYLLNKTMDKLLPRLKEDLDPDTRIVSNGFVFDGIKISKTIDNGESKVHLYYARDL
jgi:ribosomal protein L11 methylase PrmA